MLEVLLDRLTRLKSESDDLYNRMEKVKEEFIAETGQFIHL